MQCPGARPRNASVRRGSLLWAPQLLARLLRLADDHALHIFVQLLLAVPQDDDVDLLLALSLGFRVVVRPYVPAVEAVRLDELAEHLLYEPVLWCRPDVRAREHVDQRLRAAGFLRVVPRALFVESVGVAVHA